MPQNLKNQSQGRQHCPRSLQMSSLNLPKSSPRAPPTLLRAPRTPPPAPSGLPGTPRSAPNDARTSPPDAPGSSPAFKKPMVSLRKTYNSHLSAPHAPRPPRTAPTAPPADILGHTLVTSQEETRGSSELVHPGATLILPTSAQRGLYKATYLPPTNPPDRATFSPPCPACTLHPELPPA